MYISHSFIEIKKYVGLSRLAGDRFDQLLPA